MARAAASMPSALRSATPVRIAASGQFGVTTAASGTSSSRMDATASGESRESPLVATITGSST